MAHNGVRIGSVVLVCSVSLLTAMGQPAYAGLRPRDPEPPGFLWPAASPAAQSQNGSLSTHADLWLLGARLLALLLVLAALAWVVQRRRMRAAPTESTPTPDATNASTQHARS